MGTEDSGGCYCSLFFVRARSFVDHACDASDTPASRDILPKVCIDKMSECHMFAKRLLCIMREDFLKLSIDRARPIVIEVRFIRID